MWIFFAQATAASAARRIATSLLGEAFRLRGSMHLSSYDRLFPSQDVHTGRGVGNLIAAPMNGNRRNARHNVVPGSRDTGTIQRPVCLLVQHRPPVQPMMSTTLTRKLPDPQIGHHVRRLQLPTSSKIVPRPAAIIRATFGARITVNANDLGPAMISAVKHAASIRNPEFDARQRARRSTWDTPRFLYSYDETVDGDLVLPRGLLELMTGLVDSAESTLKSMTLGSAVEQQSFTCSTELRHDQTTALQQVLAKDTGILIAPPGSGKTVIACAAIASRSTSTLILVDRKALADQWRDRIQKHLGFKCGQIGGGRSKITGSSTSHCCRPLPVANRSRTLPPDMASPSSTNVTTSPQVHSSEFSTGYRRATGWD